MAVTAQEQELVESALSGVYDPELGLDIVSLGLVYGIEEEEDEIVVTMTLTTPGCPVSESLPEEAAVAVADTFGPLGRKSRVSVVWDPPWSIERISDEAASRLGIPRSKPRPVAERTD